MEKVAERCCGLDVHKKTVVACLRTPGPRGRLPAGLALSASSLLQEHDRCYSSRELWVRRVCRWTA